MGRSVTLGEAQQLHNAVIKMKEAVEAVKEVAIGRNEGPAVLRGPLPFPILGVCQDLPDLGDLPPEASYDRYIGVFDTLLARLKPLIKSLSPGGEGPGNQLGNGLQTPVKPK